MAAKPQRKVAGLADCPLRPRGARDTATRLPPSSWLPAGSLPLWLSPASSPLPWRRELGFVNSGMASGSFWKRTTFYLKMQTDRLHVLWVCQPSAVSLRMKTHLKLLVLPYDALEALSFIVFFLNWDVVVTCSIHSLASAHNVQSSLRGLPLARGFNHVHRMSPTRGQRTIGPCHNVTAWIIWPIPQKYKLPQLT